MMEKLLSLFEPDIRAIVRGKAGEEIEFGDLLVLGEQRDGLIMGWELFKEEVPGDMRLVRPSVERAESGLEVALKIFQRPLKSYPPPLLSGYCS
jgi:hypothetical protein